MALDTVDMSQSVYTLLIYTYVFIVTVMKLFSFFVMNLDQKL